MHIFDQWDADDAAAQRRRAAHRDLLKALLSARYADDFKTERALRVLVDAAPFGECPACGDRDASRERCQECHGDGFVSV
jgi:hypothetical protein